MPLLPESAFAKSIAPGQFVRAPIYILHGPEALRLNESALAIKKHLSGEIGEENYFHYLAVGHRESKKEDEEESESSQPKEAESKPEERGGGPDTVFGSTIVAQLNTMSMFGGGKLVWAGTLKWLNKEDMKSLASYAADPNPQSTLVITYDTGGKSDTFEKSELVKNAVKTGVVVKFEQLRKNELGQWVASRFELKGKKIAPAATAKLLELSDENMQRLEGEIEKLSLYIQDAPAVTLDDVEEMAADHRESEIWELTGAISRRDLPAAEKALENLLTNNRPPQMILKSLTTEIIKMALARDFKAKGKSPEEFAAALGTHPFVAKKAWGDAGKWPAGHALKSLRAVLYASMNLMKSGAEPYPALCGLVMEICGGAEKAPAAG